VSCLRHSAPAGLKRGILVSTPNDSDRAVERELIQCCHCAFTTVWVPGVEKGWAVCWRCNDWHCSKPSCVKSCVSKRQWLENKAAGRAEDYSPVRARVGADPPKSAGGVILGTG
jgi:hypothetical protein